MYIYIYVYIYQRERVRKGETKRNNQGWREMANTINMSASRTDTKQSGTAAGKT